MTAPARFSMILPCYNEEEAVPYLLENLQKLIDLLSKKGYPPPHFIFVNDGSRDRTLEILQAATRQFPDSEVVDVQPNRGIGYAVRAGFKQAKDDLVVVYESDCSYPVEDILKMLEMMDPQTDVVAASPYAPGGEAFKDVPAHRLFLSKSASFLYKLLLWPHAKHIYTFSAVFRLYRRDVFLRLNLKEDRYLFGAESTFSLLLNGARVKELPTVMRPRKFGQSKMKVLRTIVDHVRLLIRIVLHRLHIVKL